MSQWIPYLVIGLTTGSMYSLVALGLNLTYKTSGIFNFAHGALATATAYLFYYLHFEQNINWVISLIISVPVAGVVLGLLMERLANGLQNSSIVMRVAATVGVLLIIQATATLIFGTYVRNILPFLPNHPVAILGAGVPEDQLIISGVVLACTLALYVFFKTTRMGKAMRAVVDSSDLVALTGTDPAVVRRTAWIVGCFFAALSGPLLIEVLGRVDATTITSLIVAAFAAAALGRFQNLFVTYAGGLLVGVLASLASKLVQHSDSSSILQGLPVATPFIILFVLMLVLPQTREVISSAKRVAAPRWTIPWPISRWMLAALAVLLISVPLWAGFQVSSWTGMLTFLLLFLSLGLLVRTSGQVCLCIVTFAAIGAVAFSKIVGADHLPWLLGLILAGLVVVPVAAFVSIPAARLSGVFVAVATFGFGLLVQQMFYQTDLMFGVNYVGLRVPYPNISWLDTTSNSGFYYVVLIIVACCAMGILLISRTRLGRLLAALNDSPRTLATNGTNVTVLRILVFCIAGFFAAISGALYAINVTAPTGLDFDPFLSLTYVALIVIAVGSVPWYAIGAAAGFSLLQSYWNLSSLSEYLQLVFGVSAILLALSPGGVGLLPKRAREFIDRLGARVSRSKKGVVPAREATVTLARARGERARGERASGSGQLEVQGVKVQFGGLVAVDKLTLKTAPGTITGLIGPNGAGKTTTFNACCGLVRPSEGRVLLNGREVSRLGSAARATRGLGRTFQDVGLWDSLTVSQNIAMGREAVMAGQNVVRQLISVPSERQTVAAAVADVIAFCGLRELSDRIAGTLPTGQRRLVEFARCLAGSFDVVLLDEPSSGLDQQETDNFGMMLGTAARELNLALLLVEHDMRLVMNVCSYLYVMDAGTLIFEGTPAEALVSSEVRRAYLGEDADADKAKRAEHI